MAKRKTITNKKGNAIAESDSDSDAHSTRRTARERTTSSPKPKSKKQKGQEYDSDDHSKASHQTARARASTKPAQQKGQESKPPRRTARVRTASAKAMNPKGQESDSDDPPKVPLRNRAPKPKENKQKNVAPRQPARARATEAPQPRATEAPQPRATEAPQPEEQNSSDSDDLSVEEDHRTKQPRAASSKPKEKEIRDHLAILLSLLPSGAPAVIPSSTPNFPRKARGRKPTNQSEAELPVHEVGETNRQELDQFPAPALVARDRAPRKVNTGAKRKYPFGHEKATPEPKVPFHTRLLQFPQRGLAIQNGKLVCSVCPTGLSNRKGTIRTHLNSSDHKGALARNDHLIQDQQQIEQLILDRDETKRVPGQSLILPERVFRFRVERALIADGVPSSQFHNGKLKELLEQASGYTFPKDHLTSEITMIHDTEMMNLREDLKSAHQIALVFDACTEVSEVFSIIARYWNDSGLQQRLVSLKWLMHSLDANEQASHIMGELTYRLGVEFKSKVVACIRDGAALNSCCVQKLRSHYNYNLLNITCVSHMACLVGKKAIECFPELAQFSSKWSSMIKRSPSARTYFRELTEQTAARKSKVKWFAEFEMLSQLMVYWTDVIQLIFHPGEFSKEDRGVLKTLMTTKRSLIEIELSLFVDLCTPLHKLCYLAEGDGLISPLVYDDIERAKAISLSIFTSNPFTPNLLSLLKFYATSVKSLNFQPLLQQVLQKAYPVYEELKWKFYDEHREQLDLWRFCRLLNPRFVHRTPMATLQNELKTTIISSQLEFYDCLKDSLQSYKVCSAKFNYEKYPTILSFWIAKKDDLPDWYECMKFISLLQPSSAAAERVFAILRTKFSKQQESTLEDYKECSIMMEFNNRLPIA